MRYIIFFLLLLISGCSLYKNSSGKTYDAGAFTGSDRLIPIANDTSYTNHFSVKNAVSRDGWQIQYMVKDDATRYTDAYIQWEKGDVKRVYKYNKALEFRSAFMPQMVEENNTHIFMEHWCATDCTAVLVLPKNATDYAIDVESVIDYNLMHGQFVYREYKDNGTVGATAIDLKKRKKKSVTFKNKTYSQGNSFVKSINFKGENIVIEGQFFNPDGETVTETQTIRF